MIDDALFKYMTVLLTMGVITIGIVLYAIIKSDFSKKTHKLMMSIFIIDVIILVIFMIRLWCKKPILFF
jgi:cyanate permease